MPKIEIPNGGKYPLLPESLGMVISRKKRFIVGYPLSPSLLDELGVLGVLALILGMYLYFSFWLN